VIEEAQYSNSLINEFQTSDFTNSMIIEILFEKKMVFLGLEHLLIVRLSSL
jgi:hypothetical protein